MLTDIFAIRYENIPLFKAFSRREARIILQLHNLLEEIEPYRGVKGEVIESGKSFWAHIQKCIANELGLAALSNPLYQTTVGIGQFQRQEWRRRDEISICQVWMLAKPTSEESADEFIKERLSLFELGMRRKYSQIEQYTAFMGANASTADLWRKTLEGAQAKHEAASTEANARFKAAQIPLHYHNGFIQILRDDLISSEIEQPFWSLVSDPIWENVDLDMKEAIDQRDSGGKDPAFFAGKALESTIKIVSGLHGATHGGEKGAHNFIDNISKKSVAFIEGWEADFLKHYFTNVRNPLGHGPGSEPMPSLSFDQSSLAIEIAMSWIRLLVERANSRKISEGSP